MYYNLKYYKEISLLFLLLTQFSEDQVTLTQISYSNEGYDDRYYNSNAQGNGGFKIIEFYEYTKRSKLSMLSLCCFVLLLRTGNCIFVKMLLKAIDGAWRVMLIFGYTDLAFHFNSTAN